MISNFIILLSTGDWINSISAISAILTALVTLITVREIKKQREHSYHPDINIANFHFYVYRDNYYMDKNNGRYSFYYSTERLLEIDAKKRFALLEIDINNIGLGVAKQISWNWYVDFNALKKVLESDKKEPFVKYVIAENEVSVSSKELKIDWHYYINDENFGNFFNFILPYSIENRENKIRVPSSFVDLFWLYTAKEMTGDFYTNKLEYPPLCLAVNYTDIHGKEIEKRFFLRLSSNAMWNVHTENTEVAQFRFEIVEA